MMFKQESIRQSRPSAGLLNYFFRWMFLSLDISLVRMRSLQTPPPPTKFLAFQLRGPPPPRYGKWTSIGLLLSIFAGIHLTTVAISAQSPPDSVIGVDAYDRLDLLKRSSNSTVRVDAFRKGSRVIQYSSGAGVILSTDGYIVTAYHVVRDYPGLRIITQSGLKLDAELVFIDDELDLAVLKVRENMGLEAASIAAPERIRAGCHAVTIGNPFGAGQQAVTATLGDICEVRWVGNSANLRSVNASWDPGYSGGGVFDIETGELLGVCVAKSATKENVGYIVPSDQVVVSLSRRLKILEFYDTGRIQNALGVTARPVELLRGDYKVGLMVTHVIPHSAAGHANWVNGDILVGFGRYRTESISDLVYIIDHGSNQSASHWRVLMARSDSVARGSISLELSVSDTSDYGQ